MFSRWQHFEETEPPNLIGIMNLFMVLIPFLLMGAAFYHVAVIPSSLPTHTPSESSTPTEITTVTINLAILPDRLKLSAISHPLLESDVLADMAREWPKVDGKYPLKALTDHLKGIKADYYKSNTMIVLPHPTITYKTLVTILDASRDYEFGIDPRSGDALRSDLFPVVVFSKFYQEPKKTGEGGEAAEGEGEAATEEAPGEGGPE